VVVAAANYATLALGCAALTLAIVPVAMLTRPSSSRVRKGLS